MPNKNSSSSDIPAPPAAARAPRKRTSAVARPKNQNGDARHIPHPEAYPDARRAAGPEARTDAASAVTPGPTHEQIAEAAYHKYLSRQGAGGSDFDDWLEAERDLRFASHPKAQSPKPERP